MVPRNERFSGYAIAQGEYLVAARGGIKLVAGVFDKDGAPMDRKQIIGVDGEAGCSDWVVAKTAIRRNKVASLTSAVAQPFGGGNVMFSVMPSNSAHLPLLRS